MIFLEKLALRILRGIPMEPTSAHRYPPTQLGCYWWYRHHESCFGDSCDNPWHPTVLEDWLAFRRDSVEFHLRGQAWQRNFIYSLKNQK